MTLNRNLSRALLLFPILTISATPQWKPAQIWEKTLAPGLVYRQEFDPNLPRTLNAIRISPQSPVLRWSTELAGKTVNEEKTANGRLTPTLMAAQSGAIAAVNADFFSFDHGAPIGLMVRNGELITTAARPRAVFGWGPKDASVAMASSTVTATIGTASLAIGGVNQPVGQNAVGFFTPAVGTAITERANRTVILKIPEAPLAPSTTITATVENIRPDVQRIQVPTGRALLVATGNEIPKIESLIAGDTVRIQIRTLVAPSEFLNGIG